MRRLWLVPLAGGAAVALLLALRSENGGRWRLLSAPEPPGFPNPYGTAAQGDSTGAPRTRRARRTGRDAPRFILPPEPPRPEGAHRPASLSMCRRPPQTGSVAALARARDWVESLDAAARLPESDPEDLLAAWKEAFGEAEDPLARQNLIFQAALVFPFDLVRPWLEEIRRGDDAADAEDALLALAFSGEPDARAAFALLARTPEDEALLKSVCVPRTSAAIDACPPAAARRLWRSHRAIEVLDREPYFEINAVQAWYEWTDHPIALERDWKVLESELLRHWVRRYPGHTGSDDMALRIARNEADPVEAARWYSRAASWPDQDVTDGGLFGLVTVAELHLTPEEIDQLAHEEGLDTLNRMLMLYVRLRRIADERGFEVALREAGARAAAEPFCPIAQAWNSRWSVPVPRGIDSGQAPLPGRDRLRVVQAGPEEPRSGSEDTRRPVRLSWYRFPPHSEGQSRLEAMRGPPAERLVLDTEALARQYRAWETLAELERRARRARRAERSDLLYKQAAVFYHQPDVLFPVWGAHTVNFTSILHVRSATHGTPEEADARRRRFRDRVLSLRRAIEIFDRIEAEDAGYEGTDKVIFSRAMAWKKLLEIHPFRPWREEDRHELVRRLVADFERCAVEHSSSPLAAPARNAAVWWRRNVPEAW